MRISTRVVIDSETLRVLERDSYEYSGPVALCKGDAAKNQALSNASTASANSNTLFGEGQTAQNELLPFLNSEMTNPSGFGQPALNMMTTQAGQATSGSLGNTEQQAKLRAARTGNTAGESAIISAAGRNAAGDLTNADTGVQVENAQEKLKQQAAGAAGMESLAGMDTNAALNALGVSNQGVNAWGNANTAAWGPFESIMGDIGFGGKAGGMSFSV